MVTATSSRTPLTTAARAPRRRTPAARAPQAGVDVSL